jgi:ParB family transcriptional regulator, chromosome partitioning protein
MNDHQLIHQSLSPEWYTPDDPYLRAVRACLGHIELDPASCAVANNMVQAERFYTITDNGLNLPWKANTLFVNPPYGYEGAPDKRRNGEWNPRLGRPNQRIWSQKLIAEHEAGNVMQAIMLCNAQTGEQWFQPLWQYPICFVNHRIPFYTIDEQGCMVVSKNGKSGPTHASCFVYFGAWHHRFEQAFKDIGVFRWPTKDRLSALL